MINRKYLDQEDNLLPFFPQTPRIYFVALLQQGHSISYFRLHKDWTTEQAVL